jgi:hypothetical protein
MQLACIYCGVPVERARNKSKPVCAACNKKNHPGAQVVSRKKRIANDIDGRVLAVERKARDDYRERGDFSMGKRKSWTAGEEAIVLDWQGPDIELAKILGRSISGVQIRRSNLRKAMGIKKEKPKAIYRRVNHKFSEDEDKIIREYSPLVAAKKTGLTAKQIYGRRAVLGISKSKKGKNTQ